MRLSRWTPAVDISHQADDCFVKVEIAGIDPQQIDIDISLSSMRIRGRRKDMLLREDIDYHAMEIYYSHFERLITLPFSVDPDKTTWEYIDGMLMIHLQRFTDRGL